MASVRTEQPGTQLTEVSETMAAEPSDVFAELSDGWGYVGWVVGATHIRDVDERWPSPGAAIHHQVGAWPLRLSDRTIALECEPDRRLVLKARAWPMGEARVELLLVHETPTTTRVYLREGPSDGPARALDNKAMRWMLRHRNIESLRRLRDRVEHRRRQQGA